MKGKKSNSFISNVNFFITSFVKYLTLKLRPFGSQKKSVLIGCVLLFLIYYFFFKSTNPGLTSIISCKRDLAKIAIPNDRKRQEYLAPVGSDFVSVENDFYRLLSTHMTNCKSQEHLGPIEDGGYEVCLEPRFDTHKPCLVYSFGVSEDFKFERDAERVLNCEVHAFDPSLGWRSFQVSDNIYFYNYGLDNVETLDLRTGWKLKRLKNIMQELGHEGRTIDYMKMDLEFSEWLVLNDLISSGLIHNIRQLSLGVHTPEMDMLRLGEGGCSSTQPDTLAFMFRTMVELRNAGFSLFHSRTNHRIMYRSSISNRNRYCCFDLHFVNTNHPQNAS